MIKDDNQAEGDKNADGYNQSGFGGAKLFRRIVHTNLVRINPERVRVYSPDCTNMLPPHDNLKNPIRQTGYLNLLVTPTI